MKRKTKQKKKMETSKKLLIISDTLAGIATVSTIIAVFVIKDGAPLAYLIPAAFGLSATSHGFYYWKAKNENLQKYGKLSNAAAEPEDGDENTF